MTKGKSSKDDATLNIKSTQVYIIHREIEIKTLRHWVSCQNYFAQLELWWQCQQIQTLNLKTFGDELSRRLNTMYNDAKDRKQKLVKNFVIVSTKICCKCCQLNSKCGHIYRTKRLSLQGHSSNAFPWKCFVQYKQAIIYSSLVQPHVWIVIWHSIKLTDSDDSKVINLSWEVRAYISAFLAFIF